MLTVLRRVFSFSDWYQSHPKEPPPGDMLDASFDAQDNKINEIEALVGSVRRSDGALQNAIVTRDSLDPSIYGDLRFEMHLAAASERKKAEEQAELARISLLEVEKARARAESSEISARADAKVVSEAKSGVLAHISSLIGRSEALLADLRSAEAQLADSESHAGHSEAWARTSAQWAEHMPDTLPESALVSMDVTGDHWSAKWWANKADNAFGRLTDLYLGAWPTPPVTNLEGGPIEVGSIYYDTDPPPGQMYVWDGSSWQSMTQPARAMVSTLWYSASAGQTVFPLTTPDIYGHNFTISSTNPEPISVWANGVRLMPYQTPLGDWTVSGSTVTLQRPVRLEDLISFDIYLPDEALGPGAVQAWSLSPLTGKDGVKTTFALTTKASPGVPVTVSKYEELLVSLDGSIQEPGVSYTASGANISFIQAPAADSYTFITWFRPV